MKITRDVVVIGAALGGLTAIAKIASTWPRTMPVAVLISLSTKDQPARSVLQIIESYAHLKVSLAVDGEEIKPAHIYVSPPDKHLAVGRSGVVRIDEPGLFDSVRPSVNRLFSSAAAVYGPRVIGIILSGNQYDGAQGMRDIEAAGGVSIVQDPDDAIASRMPWHVIRNDSPRYRAKGADISSLVQRLVLDKL